MYRGDFKEVDNFSEDQFDREKVPRMPWRDQAIFMHGECARDLARHFIQRWNQCKREKAKQLAAYPYLLPKSYTFISDDFKKWFKEDTDFYKCSIQVYR